jgi:hypothetical protein
VRRHREVLVAVVEDQHLAVAAEPAGEAHLAARDGAHGFADGRLEIHALAKRGGAKLRVDDTPEAARDAGARDRGSE